VREKYHCAHYGEEDISEELFETVDFHGLSELVYRLRLKPNSHLLHLEGKVEE
jgi:hypothetical protein